MFRRFFSRTSVINSLKYKFQGKVTMTDVPAIKIIVESSSFNLLPKMDQHKAVLDSLPDEWKSNVVIETNALGGEIDREVRMVYLRDVNQLTGQIVPATPQSLLDDAVYNLKQNNGLLASECLWLCGSLALKNFSLAYKVDLKNHMAKNYLVKFIASQFGKTIYKSWKDLERCHANAYEDLMLLEMIQDSLEEGEKFCNLLYEYHCENKFDFKKAVPEWMHQETKTKDGTKIKKLDLYFRVM